MLISFRSANYDKSLQNSIILVSLLAVGFLWGATNPFLRLGSQGFNKIESTSKINTFLLEFKFLITRWQYVIPFLLNQSGSILYVLTLQNTDLSICVPIANSLSFVFTAIFGSILGETTASNSVYLGTTLVIVGSTMCLLDKVYVDN